MITLWDLLRFVLGLFWYISVLALALKVPISGLSLARKLNTDLEYLNLYSILKRKVKYSFFGSS